MEWQPIDTIPPDVEVRLRWPDGAEAIGMLMSPAPMEIDPEQEWFWGVDALSYSDGDWLDARDEHAPDMASGWKPLGEPRRLPDPPQ